MFQQSAEVLLSVSLNLNVNYFKISTQLLWNSSYTKIHTPARLHYTYTKETHDQM
jgi:hypothetical protein